MISWENWLSDLVSERIKLNLYGEMSQQLCPTAKRVTSYNQKEGQNEANIGR